MSTERPKPMNKTGSRWKVYAQEISQIVTNRYDLQGASSYLPISSIFVAHEKETY
jgi:hypothetical protein